MFELGKPASSAVPKSALVLATKRMHVPMMTLSEKVLSLFQQLRAPVFRYLLRRTQDAARAEDLTQETFLRLYRHLEEERPLDNPKAWLLTVAHHLAIDTSRNERREKDWDERIWKDIEESRSSEGTDPEKLLLQRERLHHLHRAVLNLTPLQRQCLHLRAEGLRYREIAELLDLSISTVVDAVRRATVKLSRELETEVSA